MLCRGSVTKCTLLLLRSCKPVNFATQGLLIGEKDLEIENKFYQFSGGEIGRGPGPEWVAGRNRREAGEEHVCPLQPNAPWKWAAHENRLPLLTWVHISYSIVLWGLLNHT